MKVYLVCGGCWGDEHVIAMYLNQKNAEKRAKKENEECKGLGAYVEEWEVEE